MSERERIVRVFECDEPGCGATAVAGSAEAREWRVAGVRADDPSHYREYREPNWVRFYYCAEHAYAADEVARLAEKGGGR